MCHASCCHAFRAIDLSTGSSASFAIPVFMNLEGWRLLYSNFIRDYWYPLLSLVPWCGHRCALPISWSHKWELCICGRPVFLSTSISKMSGLTGLQRCYSSQYTPYTIHVSINVDRHVNFVRPSIRSHSVSFVFFGSVRLMLHLSRTIVLKLTCILLSLQTKF